MEKLTFQDFNILCELNIDKKHAGDCLDLIRNEDCIYDGGIIMPHDHIANLYKLRLTIAKAHGKSTEEYLADFENAVLQMQRSTSEMLGLTWVSGDHVFFITFYEPGTKLILGILQSKSKEPIRSLEDHFTGIIDSGYTSSAEKYSKGRFVRDWK